MIKCVSHHNAAHSWVIFECGVRAERRENLHCAQLPAATGSARRSLAAYFRLAAAKEGCVFSALHTTLLECVCVYAQENNTQKK